MTTETKTAALERPPRRHGARPVMFRRARRDGEAAPLVHTPQMPEVIPYRPLDRVLPGI